MCGYIYRDSGYHLWKKRSECVGVRPRNLWNVWINFLCYSCFFNIAWYPFTRFFIYLFVYKTCCHRNKVYSSGKFVLLNILHCKKHLMQVFIVNSTIFSCIIFRYIISCITKNLLHPKVFCTYKHAGCL